jgi:hypothetical protein
MVITVNFPPLGKPYKQGEPMLCSRCGKPVPPNYHDRMEAADGRIWLYCEACTVAIFSSAQIETEH